jgi:hypothetical protein
MYILGHQGWTDFLSQLGLYIHFAKSASVTVLVVNAGQLPYVRRLLEPHAIRAELLETVSSGDVCVICHQPGSPKCCPRTGTPCRYAASYPDFQGLCAFDDFAKWSECVSSPDRSFVEAFYAYHNVPFEEMGNALVIQPNPGVDLSALPSPYIVYHDQPSLQLESHQIQTRLPRIPLHECCDDILSAIPLLQGASEIHVIPSVYCMLVYLLQQRDGLFRDIPVIVYESVRGYSSAYRRMYRTPQLPNWRFV